ncbi:hypothetical protein [Glaciecola sp. SC05]|uniref:hypothetical protein n=1 Tax=Glaciecola sp. SC05 TaxID=1987355 RepID=UPI00352802AD
MKIISYKTLYLAFLFLSVISVSNAALVITSNQSVNVSGKYIPLNPPNVPDPRKDLSTSYNGSNTGGTSEFDFELADKGIDNASAFWQVNIDQGRLKTYADLSIKHDFMNSPSFTDLNVDMQSTISYDDTITVRRLVPSQDPVPTNLYVRFQVDLTGDLFNTVNYLDPSQGGATTANYFTDSSFFSRIANSRAQASEEWQVESTSSYHSNGVFGSNVDEFANLNASVVFEDLLWKGSAIFFDWTYSELFNVEIEGIDAGSIDLRMTNDLSNTIITRASVFDANGNWLPEYVVQSGGGFDYAQMFVGTPVTPVSAPSIASLVLLSFLGISMRRRAKF